MAKQSGGNGQGQAGSPSASGTRQAASVKKYLPKRPAGGVSGSRQMKMTVQKGK